MNRVQAAAAIVTLVAHDAFAQHASPIRIVSFEPEQRRLAPGGDAVSEIAVLNEGPTERHVWIGYSVQSPEGSWFDVAALPVVLGPTSTTVVRRVWPIPSTVAEDGRYRVVMAVWSAPPESAEAERLASVDRRDTFTIVGANDPEHAIEFGGVTWRAADHVLGRGRMLPHAVAADSSGVALHLLAGRCDGAEVRTSETFTSGNFNMRMTTPRAPGSLSAFFLYGIEPDRNDEIDIEIYNDESRRAILTAWVAGVATNKAELRLPFDPSSGTHEYDIRWSRNALVLVADGVELASWHRRIPQRPMRLMANVWWPSWLDCVPLAETRALLLHGARIESASP